MIKTGFYSINYKFYSIFLSINRRLSSQISKTNEIEEQKSLNNLKNNEKIDNILKEKIRNDLEEVVKQRSDKQIDRIWELNQNYDHKKEYNKITDWKSEVTQPLRQFYQKHFYNESILNQLKHFGLKKQLKHNIDYIEENTQKYVPKRHAKLGPELAIANFVVERGGKVMFKHSPEKWSTNWSHFPKIYDKRYKVISIDASNLKLRYEAIDNFIELESLESLNLSDNKLDDWSCDKMGRLFRNSKNLSSLDISNNPLITHRGIETLHRIRSLKILKISGTEAAKYPFLELLVLSFNDLVPNCQIIV